ncbi:hypothetical protein KSS87_000922 [Heliosperma pusillum]|nr:hypothetical protein KSS87_000922 [Heliosperma pusillum]
MAGLMKLLAVVVGLLFQVPDTMQLSIDHPLHTVVERLNVNAGPFLGLIVSSSRYETALIDSSYYEPDASIPYITIAGRTFNFGKFNGEPVIYVLAGEPLANVGVTVQILLDTFRIKGVINFGSSATVSNQVFIADVVVPSQVAFTGVVRWELASQLNFGERPTVHLGEGVRVGSSDIYVKNVAYATFLNKQLNVTAIDTETAAFVATSIANGVPHIVFKGTSNRPGSDSDSRLSEVTAKNVLKTVAVFIGSLSPKTNANVY